MELEEDRPAERARTHLYCVDIPNLRLQCLVLSTSLDLKLVSQRG